MSNAIYDKTRLDVDELGRNKLHYAANNGSTLVAKILINQGYDVNAQDANGWTALHFAAQNNHFDIIDLLLDNNADPNLYDKQGNGPLWIAAMHTKGDNQGVVALLKSNADPEHKNHHGRTPKYIAHTLNNELDEIFSAY